MIYLNQKLSRFRQEVLVTGITALGNVSSGLCETEVEVYQGQNPKSQGQGQRQIETTCTRVKDIRRTISN